MRSLINPTFDSNFFSSYLFLWWTELPIHPYTSLPPVVGGSVIVLHTLKFDAMLFIRFRDSEYLVRN